MLKEIFGQAAVDALGVSVPQEMKTRSRYYTSRRERLAGFALQQFLPAMAQLHTDQEFTSGSTEANRRKVTHVAAATLDYVGLLGKLIFPPAWPVINYAENVIIRAVRTVNEAQTNRKVTPSLA